MDKLEECKVCGKKIDKGGDNYGRLTHERIEEAPNANAKVKKDRFYLCNLHMTALLGKVAGMKEAQEMGA